MLKVNLKYYPGERPQASSSTCTLTAKLHMLLFYSQLRKVDITSALGNQGEQSNLIVSQSILILKFFYSHKGQNCGSFFQAVSCLIPPLTEVLLQLSSATGKMPELSYPHKHLQVTVRWEQNPGRMIFPSWLSISVRHFRKPYLRINTRLNVKIWNFKEAGKRSRKKKHRVLILFFRQYSTPCPL